MCRRVGWQDERKQLMKSNVWLRLV